LAWGTAPADPGEYADVLAELRKIDAEVAR
jgi:hypothetical protein